jgi:hypothetical protein
MDGATLNKKQDVDCGRRSDGGWNYKPHMSCLLTRARKKTTTNIGSQRIAICSCEERDNFFLLIKKMLIVIAVDCGVCFVSFTISNSELNSFHQIYS